VHELPLRRKLLFAYAMQGTRCHLKLTKVSEGEYRIVKQIGHLIAEQELIASGNARVVQLIIVVVLTESEDNSHTKKL
jgi:hypothetical protein